MKKLIFCAPFLVLSACAEPMIRDSDVIRTAMDPTFTYNEGGVVIPTSCQPGRASTYSGTPAGCARDVAFAKQILNPSDMVDPVPPGPPPSGPIARAADTYLNGGVEPAGGGGAMMGGMRGTPRTLRPLEAAGMGAGTAGAEMGGTSQLPYDPYATGR